MVTGGLRVHSAQTSGTDVTTPGCVRDGRDNSPRQPEYGPDRKDRGTNQWCGRAFDSSVRQTRVHSAGSGDYLKAKINPIAAIAATMTTTQTHSFDPPHSGQIESDSFSFMPHFWQIIFAPSEFRIPYWRVAVQYRAAGSSGDSKWVDGQHKPAIRLLNDDGQCCHFCCHWIRTEWGIFYFTE